MHSADDGTRPDHVTNSEETRVGVVSSEFRGRTDEGSHWVTAQKKHCGETCHRKIPFQCHLFRYKHFVSFCSFVNQVALMVFLFSLVDWVTSDTL